MAWDNAPWPQPPNGAQYISAAGNLAKQLSDIINGVGTAYREGQNFQYQQRQRDLFQGGLPSQTDANGNPVLDKNGQPVTDYAAMFNRVVQSGGTPAIGAVAPLLDRDSQQQFYDALRRLQPNNGPNTSPSASIAAAAPANLGAGGQPQPQLSATGSDSAGDNQETPRSSVGGMSAISPRPTSGAGGFGPSSSGTMAGAPQSFDQRFNAAYGGQGGPASTPIGTLKDAERADEMASRYLQLSAAPRISPQQAAAAKAEGERWASIAKEIRSQLGEYGMKPANNPFVQGSIKQYAGVGEAKAKRIGEVIEAGGLPAHRMLNDLNLMEDAIRSTNNIAFGPGADAWLKVKQVAANLGIDMAGRTEAEATKKLNTQLASAAAKAMTSRPTQFEVKQFMAANPGLETSRTGTLTLISILKQMAQQDIGLSRKAMNARNLENWSDVEDEHYRQNPIVSPFTGKPLRGDESVPGMGGGGGQAAGRLRPGGRYIWTPQGLVPEQ